MTTHEQRLAKVMQALLSRPDHWAMEEYSDPTVMTVNGPLKGWRLVLWWGEVELDKEHAMAIDPERFGAR